jgi:hypothetical protein
MVPRPSRGWVHEWHPAHPDMICEVFVFASTDLVSGDELRD